MSTPATRRPRRQRSTTESLLSIVLLLEAILLFFVVLVLFGLKTVSPALAFGGGAAFVVVILLTILLLRWPVGIAIGWVIQAALIALGVFNPVIYVVGAGFAAFWIWCFVRARQIDRARRAYLAAHPAPLVEPVETTPAAPAPAAPAPDPAPEGETP